jgi:hypothetical protein
MGYGSSDQCCLVTEAKHLLESMGYQIEVLAHDNPRNLTGAERFEAELGVQPYADKLNRIESAKITDEEGRREKANYRKARESIVNFIDGGGGKTSLKKLYKYSKADYDLVVQDDRFECGPHTMSKVGNDWSGNYVKPWQRVRNTKHLKNIFILRVICDLMAIPYDKKYSNPVEPYWDPSWDICDYLELSEHDHF